MNKRKYPRTWRKIRATILERDNYTCQQCYVNQYAIGYFDAAGRYVPATGSTLLNKLGTKGTQNLRLAKAWLQEAQCLHPNKPWQVMILAVAHLDQNTRNNDPANLKTLCQRCHFAYDRRHNVPKLVDARKYGRKRGKNQLGFAFSTPLFDANKSPKPPSAPPKSEVSRPDLTHPSSDETA